MSLINDMNAARRTLPSFALMGVLWGGFHAYAPQTKAAAGAGDWAFGLVLFASALGSLLAMTLAPRFERMAGPRTLALSGGLMIAGFQLLGFASGVVGLAMVMVLVGAGMGLVDVLMNAQVSRDEADSGCSLMNLNHGTYSLAYACAALVAAPMRAAGLGLDVFFWGAALIGLAALWPVRSVHFEGGSGAGPAARTDPLPPVVLWAGVIVLFGFACENAVESWSALHIERTLGGNPAQGALGPAALGLTMAAGRFGGHLVVSRFSESWLITRASLLAAFGAGVAAVAVAPWMAYVGFALAGLGISVLAPMALALIGQRVPARLRTRAIARGAVIGYLGFFFGPPMVGAVAELAGLRGAFGVVTLALIAVPVILRRSAR